MTKISRFTVVVGSNNCIYVWRKCDEVNRPDLVCRPSQRKVSVMIWRYLSLSGIGTLTDVKGNINSQIYIDVLENNLWPVIARYFADNEYVTTWPAQSPNLIVCENVWLHIKRPIQPIAGNDNTQNELIAEIRRVWESLPVTYIPGFYQTIPTLKREVGYCFKHFY